MFKPWSGHGTGVINRGVWFLISHLPELDFCFYCRAKIPTITFPHICDSCLEIIRNGGQPVTVMVQSSLDDEVGVMVDGSC